MRILGFYASILSLPLGRADQLEIGFVRQKTYNNIVIIRRKTVGNIIPYGSLALGKRDCLHCA